MYIHLHSFNEKHMELIDQQNDSVIMVSGKVECLDRLPHTAMETPWAVIVSNVQLLIYSAAGDKRRISVFIVYNGLKREDGDY